MLAPDINPYQSSSPTCIESGFTWSLLSYWVFQAASAFTLSVAVTHLVVSLFPNPYTEPAIVWHHGVLLMIGGLFLCGYSLFTTVRPFSDSEKNFKAQMGKQVFLSCVAGFTVCLVAVILVLVLMTMQVIGPREILEVPVMYGVIISILNVTIYSMLAGMDCSLSSSLPKSNERRVLN